MPRILPFSLALLSAIALHPALAAEPLPLGNLKLPPGFELRVLADDVPNARQMALSAAGTLYVGTRREGKVYAIEKVLSDTGRAPAATILANLTMPSGIAIRDGDLYVGAVSQILKVADADAQLAARKNGKDLPTVVVADDLPTEKHHGWKYLKFDPAGRLLVPVGAPCNICLSEDPRFAALLAMNPATGQSEVIASGIRNTVGFATHPGSGALWFTDNGRDMLGDDVPPEEINILAQPGKHYGYPFIHGGTIADPEFGKNAHPDAFEPPVLKVQAHSALLGVDFYTGAQFPARYRGALFVAEHGSWNRSKKVGFRIGVALNTQADATPSYEPFIEGWLQGEDNWGRPNDVLAAPDGSLLISDDQAGAIYQVRYREALADR